MTGLNQEAYQRNECGQFMDKHLKEVLDKIEDGIDKLNRKYPHAKKPKIKSGLRGPRYFIEFPITGHKVDAFGLILATEKLI
mgnify:CR=1 FL=1